MVPLSNDIVFIRDKKLLPVYFNYVLLFTEVAGVIRSNNYPIYYSLFCLIMLTDFFSSYIVLPDSPIVSLSESLNYYSWVTYCFNMLFY